MARLNELYRWVRLYVNFFLPSQKLQQKIREGSRVYKRYDRAQTPYQRVLESEAVSDEHKGKLRAQYQRWNPAELHRQIRRLQEELLARHRGLPVPACACPHADRPNSSWQAGPRLDPKMEILSGTFLFEANGNSVCRLETGTSART